MASKGLLLYISQCFFFIPCMSIRLLSTSWFDTMHIVIQSNYSPTCFGGGHYHHQGRQYHSTKNTAIRRLSCAHRFISRPPSTQRLWMSLAADLQTGRCLKSARWSRYIILCILELTTPDQHMPCMFWMTGISMALYSPPWTIYNLARKAQDLIVGRTTACKNTTRRATLGGTKRQWDQRTLSVSAGVHTLWGT